MKITVGVSNKHAHLTRKQLDILFGTDYELTFLRGIKQRDEFVSNAQIDVEGPKGILKGVRVVGPLRENAQLEMTLTNAREIGIEILVRNSQDLEGTTGAVKLIGPAGTCTMDNGIIAARRHLHLNPEEAEMLCLNEGDEICVETVGPRSVIFNNVLVRINELFSLELHLDTDEANAAGLKHGDSLILSGVAEKA